MPSVLELLGPQGRIAAIYGAAYEARQPQLTMATAVQRAVLTRTPLVVEAGTGTGKSLAYLVGGIAARARVVVSTSSKALQGQLLTQDLPLPLPARALGHLVYCVAKGKSNYLCLWKARGRQGRFAGGGVDVRALTAWADTTANGDLDTVPTALPGAVRDQLTAGSDALGNRYYTANPPQRLLLALPAGLAPCRHPARRYLQAQLGWDNGAGPYTLPESAGKRHRRITVEALLTAPPAGVKVLVLSDLVAAAPHSDRAGGRRGEHVCRPLLTPESGHLEAQNITLPGDLWRRIEQLGGGNRSAGVRRLAEGVSEEQEA